MIIHCFNIFNICRAICNDESLSERNAMYLIAGIAEMGIFDFIIYNLMR
jgi:hypothetical protein